MIWCPMPDAGWIEVDSLAGGEGFDRAIFRSVGFVMVLNIVIEREDRLLGVVDCLRADGFELAHHRRGIVVGHGHERGRMETKSPVRRGRLRSLGKVSLCDLFDNCLGHTSSSRRMQIVSDALNVHFRALAAFHAALGHCFGSLGMANVRFHERHQFCHRTDMLKIPDDIPTLFWAALLSTPSASACELFFDILIREWVAWITLGIIQLFVERATVSCIHMHDYPL